MRERWVGWVGVCGCEWGGGVSEVGGVGVGVGWDGVGVCTG